jgi:hypothetical protein
VGGTVVPGGSVVVGRSVVVVVGPTVVVEVLEVLEVAVVEVVDSSGPEVLVEGPLVDEGLEMSSAPPAQPEASSPAATTAQTARISRR